MTTKAVDVGSLADLDFTFKDRDGVLADPTSIALIVREPDGVEIAKTKADMTKVSNGLFRYSHAVAKAGRHVARADGDGAADAAGSLEFYARAKGTG